MLPARAGPGDIRSQRDKRQEFPPAAGRFGEALGLHEATRDLEGMADDLFGFGEIEHRQGRLEPARRALTRALAIWQAIGNRQAMTPILLALE